MTLDQRNKFQDKVANLDKDAKLESPIEPVKSRSLFLDLTQWLITTILVVVGLVGGWLFLPQLLELLPPGRQRYWGFIVYVAFVRIAVAIFMTGNRRDW